MAQTPAGDSFGAPAALARNGKLAQLLLDSAPDAMVIVNTAGHIVLVNRQTERLFGYRRQDLLDRPVEMLIPDRFRSRHIEHRRRYADDPRVRPMAQGLDLFGLYRDGTEFPVEICLSPLRISGHLLVSAAIRDVTERKVAETERQGQRLILQRLLDLRSNELASKDAELKVAETMASIGTIAAGLVHDLNNALLPIRSRLDAMKQQECTAESRSHIDGLDSTIDYIANLCHRIRMLMTNDDAGSNQEDATNLRDWWREVEPLVSSALPHQIELKPEIPEDVPPVRVSRLDLTQAVFNLAHNAGRAMSEQASGTIKIWAKFAADDHVVHVGVSDNGPGMPPHVKERCMEPMFTTTQDGEGVGLGLLLVRSIVARAKGSIDVESEPGRGTTFTLAFPATVEKK